MPCMKYEGYFSHLFRNILANPHPARSGEEGPRQPRRRRRRRRRRNERHSRTFLFSPPPPLCSFFLVTTSGSSSLLLLLHENERDLLGKQMRAHRGRERKGLFFSFLFPPEGLVQGKRDKGSYFLFTFRSLGCHISDGDFSSLGSKK